MNIKDTQELLLQLHNKSLNGREIYQHIRGVVPRRTVFDWLKLINLTGAIHSISKKAAKG